MGKIKHLKLQIVICLVIQTIFTACLAAAIPQSRAAWSALQAFSVGPFALVVLACYVIAGLNISLKHLGLATGLIGTFRSLGGSIGNAIFNAIIQGVVGSDLGPSIATAAFGAGYNDTNGLELLIPATMSTIVGIPNAFEDVPGVTASIEAAAVTAARQVYAKAFRMVFYATIPFGVIALILACFIRDPSIYLTNHTAIRMEREGIFGKGPTDGAETSEKATIQEAEDGRTR